MQQQWQSLCTNCHTNPSNPSRKWCQSCFVTSQQQRQFMPQFATPPQSLCTNCHTNPSNPGRKWCQSCFVGSQQPQPQQQQQPLPRFATPQGHNCRNCGGFNPNNYNFCNSCGVHNP